MSMEASSLSFNSEDWGNLEETKPFSAVYAVKKEVQTGTYSLLTLVQCASNLVEASDLHLTICYNF